jgi:hypothetical protein
MNTARLREVACRGGTRTAQLHDMAMIGRVGGRQTAKRGSRYFAGIGRFGGQGFKPTEYLCATAAESGCRGSQAIAAAADLFKHTRLAPRLAPKT